MNASLVPPPSEARSPAEQAWRKLIRRTRNRIHLGWLADALLPLSLGAGTLACAGLLILRGTQRLPALPPLAWIAACAISLLLLSGAAYLRSRRHFITIETACTRLEAHLGLHSALTAANHGLRPWPPLSASIQRLPPGGLQWNWLSLVAPPLLALLLTALPFALPPPKPEPSPFPPGEPLAWETMDQWLNQLREEKVANPDHVQELQKVLDDLRNSPPSEWFRDASLEATDSLQRNIEQSMQELESALSRSAQALSLLEASSSPLSAADRQTLQSQLSQSIEQLGNSELGLHPSSLHSLRALDPSSLSADPATAKALGESLRRNAQALREALSQSESRRQQWERQLQADALLGTTGTGASGSCAGDGAPTRGPGEAPLSYAPDPVDLNTAAPERLAGFDPARAAPGDVVGVDYSKPPVEQTAAAAGSGGDIIHSGQGGQETWQPALLPSERAVLRKYFR